MVLSAHLSTPAVCIGTPLNLIGRGFSNSGVNKGDTMFVVLGVADVDRRQSAGGERASIALLARRRVLRRSRGFTTEIS